MLSGLSILTIGPGVWIAIGAGVLVVGYLIMTYNGLVKLRQQVKNAWSDIDVQLQRRHDLIPNLVEIAKGYMKHEEGVLTEVTEARAGAEKARQAADGGPTELLMAAETQLTSAMRGFMLQVEAYPDLKANQNMMQLSEEVTTTENKVSFARQYYNDSTTRFNIKTETFPSNIVAGMFGFKQATLFEVDDREAMSKAPDIKF